MVNEKAQCRGAAGNCQLSPVHSPLEEVPPGYKRTDVGVIPEDWEVKIISEVANVKTGPFGSALHERDYVQDGTPIITVEHLGEHGVVHENLPLVSDSDRARLKSYSLRENDIVFSRVGSVDRNSLVSNAESGWLFSGRLLRVRVADGSLYPPYLSYHFHSEPFKQRVREVAVGQTMASLNTQILKGVRVVLPPPPEQRAIAEALSDVDGLLGALEALIAKKRAIKQAAMQQLLTGKTRLPGFTGKWETASLDEVSTRITGFWGAAARSERATNLVGVIRAGDISPLGELSSFAHRYFSDSEQAKAECRVGDVVMTVSGNGLGKAWLVDGGASLVASNFVRILRANSTCAAAPFLSYALKGDTAARLLVEHTATSAYPNLRPSFFSTPWLRLPPVEEQQAIATVLSDMDAEIAALEARRDKTRAIKQGMMQQLLTGRVRLVQPEVAA